MITRLTFDQIITAVHDAYEACKDIKGGQNAHYIPYLANINPSLFGISLCLPDGRLISVGDTGCRSIPSSPSCWKTTGPPRRS